MDFCEKATVSALITQALAVGDSLQWAGCVQGLEGYVHRLQPAVWDHAFCLEGRSSGELPEALLACVRGIHWDFNTAHDFPADISIDPGPAPPCFGKDE